MDTNTEDDIVINDLLVERNLAIYDENTKDLLKPPSNDNSSSTDESDWNESSEYNHENSSLQSDENDMGIDFSNFECDVPPEFLSSLLNGDFQQNTPLPPTRPAKKPDNTVSAKKEISEIRHPIAPTLGYVAKVPNVTWQQFEEIIVLTIKATDNMAYNLRVTHNALVYR